MSIIIKAEAVIPKERKRNQYAPLKQEYHWTRKDEGFELVLPNGWYGALRPIGESWEMRMKTDEDFIGTRKTLEDAFQVLDKIIYSKNREYWLKMRCHIIVEEYGGIKFDRFGDLK